MNLTAFSQSKVLIDTITKDTLIAITSNQSRFLLSSYYKLKLLEKRESFYLKLIEVKDKRYETIFQQLNNRNLVIRQKNKIVDTYIISEEILEDNINVLEKSNKNLKRMNSILIMSTIVTSILALVASIL